MYESIVGKIDLTGRSQKVFFEEMWAENLKVTSKRKGHSSEKRQHVQSSDGKENHGQEARWEWKGIELDAYKRYLACKTPKNLVIWVGHKNEKCDSSS